MYFSTKVHLASLVVKNGKDDHAGGVELQKTRNRVTVRDGRGEEGGGRGERKERLTTAKLLKNKRG